jgi:biotin carboxylase
MVKASSRSGGQGIFPCETPAELSAACQQLADEGAKVLVREFVPGPDADCSFLAVAGQVLAATTQHSLTKGKGDAPAAEICLHPYPELRAMAERLAAAPNGMVARTWMRCRTSGTAPTSCVN